MDVHLEVVLERVKQLAAVSKKTVWFELYDMTSKHPSMILINGDNKIGLINLKYVNKTPDMSGYIINKKAYDDIVDGTSQISDVIKNTTPNLPVKDIVYAIAR